MSDTLNIFGTEYTGVTSIIAKDDNENDLTYIRPQGAKSITQNGNNIDVAEYATVNVSVSGGTPTLETITKSYTPSTSAVTDTITPSTGYDGIEEVDVTVSAVPMADFSPIVSGNFVTESGVKKWRVGGGGYAETAGWIDEGAVDVTQDYSAVPSNTTVTPTESAQTIGGYEYMMEGAVTVNAIPSSYVGSGVTRRDSTDLAASGATVTAPAGYYSSSASKSVASGTEGTPTATKGTVSNHSITVTPSVTNTAGYISGSTKTGTAVTVNVAELESGTKSITNNGTGISVSGYSAVDVAVQGGVVVTDVPNLTGTGASVTADDVTTLVTKTITQNGTYSASSDSADGYSSVTVNVSGGGSATQHTIHLEFSDSTDTDIPVYYNDSLLGTMITAYEPSTWTYSSKTVVLAQLDSVTWYDKQSIPLNTQLIDYTKVTDNTVINSSGQAVSEQWYFVSDYTPIASGMTFTFSGCRWWYAAFYDSSKAVISSFYIDNYTTQSSYNSNIGDGTLNSGIPANAAYIRITGSYQVNSNCLSLIRTA